MAGKERAHGRGAGEGAGSRKTPTARAQQTPPGGARRGRAPHRAPRQEPSTANPGAIGKERIGSSGSAPAALSGPSPPRDKAPAPPRRPSPWLTSRKAWVKDGSSESFSAISSGRYFSSMAAARSGSGAGAPGAPAGKERVRVPGGDKSSEAALPPGRLPPGAAGTHPEGSAASPRPGGGKKGARAGGTPPLSGQEARTNHSAEAHK